MKALEQQEIHYDAIYQHDSLFFGDSRGNCLGGNRFFSMDKILKDTSYTAAQTVFLTSVD